LSNRKYAAIEVFFSLILMGLVNSWVIVNGFFGYFCCYAEEKNG